MFYREMLAIRKKLERCGIVCSTIMDNKSEVLIDAMFVYKKEN